jgi:hypothetical protein
LEQASDELAVLNEKVKKEHMGVAEHRKLAKRWMKKLEDSTRKLKESIFKRAAEGDA